MTTESTSKSARGIHIGIAIALVVVFGLALTLIAPSSPIDDLAAAPTALSNPPGVSVNKSPPIPPWYQVSQPAPAPPGTMIKNEVISGAPKGTKVWRIMYHSRDNNGNDVPVSGLYAAPESTPPTGGFPLIIYAHGTTGDNQHCGISQTPYEPESPGYYSFQDQILPLVKQGYAVVGTDYQGMGAPGKPMYLVGEIEGQNMLDAARAAQSWQSNLNRSKNIIWGHSQGGHSAAFAAQIAPTYAPDLAIQGAAVLAPGLLPTLPFAVDTLVGGTKPTGQTGFVMLIADSWAATYPDQINLKDILTPAGLAKIDAVRTKCGDQMSNEFMDAPMSKYVRSPIPKPFYDLAALNTPGVIKTQMPIAMVQGLKDTTIIPQLTLGFNKLLCQINDTVDFRIYPNDTHPGVVVNSAPFLDSWIADRLNSKPAPNNCPNLP